MAELIKVDRNGSKHWAGRIKCDRCGGNGGSDAWKFTGWTCYKCHGEGWVLGTWIERTPEYQAKLDAKRAARNAARQAEWEAQMAEIEAKRKAEEERREAERKAEEAKKAISKFVGNEGERTTFQVTYEFSAWYKVHDPFGREETRYIHNFRDTNGNKLVWKTGCCPDINEGDTIALTGTVKEHSEYKGEKQTVLTRCKVKGA